jgi:hypothetical protein
MKKNKNNERMCPQNTGCPHFQLKQTGILMQLLYNSYGEVTKYTNWNVNQPANTNSQNENCVMINKTVSDGIKLTFHLFIRMGIQYSFTTTYAISAYHH